MNEAPFAKFRTFYDSLVRSATAKGIILADAQDLAGDAIEHALSGFDPAKGEFSAFCHTILSNLMKNYWRDKKKTEELPEEGPVDPDPPIDPLELAETIHEIRAALADIKKSLSTEENVFLNHLQEVLDESGPRAISEAARRSGLTPAKGWDLFRKIQRKARGLPAMLELRESMSEARIETPRALMVEQPRATFSSASRDIFARFTPDQLRRIESLLP